MLLTFFILGCVRISDADLAERLAGESADDTGTPCPTAWWYLDADGDGYGDPGSGLELCEGPAGHVTNDADCDDTDAAISPQTSWHYDGDGDGYGDAVTTYTSCEQPEGYTADATDCDDLDALTFPGAGELCDGEDNDCDGTADNDVTDAGTFFADTDADGFGDPEATLTACEAPSGYVTDSSDCDDTDSLTNPDAEEICSDGVDNNCDDSPGECALSGALSLSDADGILWGEARFDYAGLSLGSSEDLTGDGAIDLLISSSHADYGGSGSGSVYLVSGPVSGTDTLSIAAGRVDGTESDGRLGAAVAAGDDIDGDGLVDLLLGASLVDAGAVDAGIAYLMSGPITGVIAVDEAAGAISGVNANDRLGTALAVPGDVSGDGLADLLLGAYGEDTGGTGAGAAYLVLGPATGGSSAEDAVAVFWGEATGDRAGLKVSGAGDVNGDGLADLLIGADRNGAGSAGAAYVVLGGVSGAMSLADADWKLSGESDSDEAGSAVGSAGDVDGDGLDDVLVGGSGGDGVAWLVSGAGLAVDDLADATARIDGESGDELGASLVSAGDVDGDGQPDLLIGGPGSQGAGAAWLFYGPLSGSRTAADADVTLSDTEKGAGTGYALAAPGDVSGDGLADLLISAPSADSSGTSAGKIYFILGAGL